MYTVSLIDYNGTPTQSTPTPVREELLIYQSGISDEGLAVTEPMLSIAASSAGTFTCKLPVTNYGYDRIIKKVTRAIVKKDNKIIFMGRINTEDKDIYLTETIQAEGALAYLNDSLTDKRVFTASNDDAHTTASLADIVLYVIDNHNAKYPNEPWKQFTLRTCTANFVGRNTKDVNSREISYYSVNFFTSMECMSELLGLANAVLKTDYNDETGKWDIHIYPRYQLPDCSQTIEFGENLLDLVQTYDDTSLCSAVAPFGGDLIQESKEIGEVVAGAMSQYVLLTSEPSDWSTNYYDYFVKIVNDVTHEEYYKQVTPGASAPVFIQDTYYKLDYDTTGIYYRIFLRGDNDYDYYIYSSQDENAWAFEFDIAGYNQNHPNNPLKKLYVSWRSIKYSNEGYTCDNAWRLVTRMEGTDQSLGFHELTSTTHYESEINEEIDLSNPNYQGVTHIKMGGFGKVIKPTIRRDASVVEENNKLDITKCDYIDAELDEDGIGHDNDSPYLFSLPYLNSFGKIEKKLEYDIEDNVQPLGITHPYSGPYGGSAVYDGHALGYVVSEDNQNFDYEKFKGEYYVIPFAAPYKVIEMEIPDLGSPSRPRGMYISSRMHVYGDLSYAGKTWKIDGMYCFMDSSHKVLAYKSAEPDNKGVGFTSIKREFIDLSDAQYYGTKYIRIGGYIGDFFPLELVPSDDSYARDRLLAQARLYLTSQQWEKVVIEATAVDLNMVSDEWEAFDICRSVNVFSYRHKFSANLPITALDIQLDAFENNNIKLGYDSDEYLSAQLSDNLRLMSVEQTIEEKRRNET